MQTIRQFIKEAKEIIVEKHDEFYYAMRDRGLGTRIVAFGQGVVVTILILGVIL